MRKLTNDKLIRISTGKTTSKVGGDKIPLPLLLKLSEECGELVQAVMKGVNKNSSGYSNLEKVFEEAGHVLFFIRMLDKKSKGQVSKSCNARKRRVIKNPK